MSNHPNDSGETALSPQIQIPSSTYTVTVRVIDTTLRIHMPVGTMFDPLIKGHTKLASPCFSFLIEHEKSGRKLLYDLGVLKNWKDQPPEVADQIEGDGCEIEVEKDVAEILTEHGGTPLEEVEAIIWGHWHLDHLGDPATFPNSTTIIVGPGFKKEFFLDDDAKQPKEDSPIPSSFYADRTLREISELEFDLNIAGFSVFDYFGDGSFYLVNSPGHTIGHMSGLARTTTNPDTFIFIGGDIASHPGTWPDGQPTNEDPVAALESHEKLQLVDAQSQQVFVILAHDECMQDVIEFYPKDANRWKELGWGDKARWLFLGDFKEAVTIEGIDDLVALALQSS